MANQIDYERNTTYGITHIYQKNGVNSSDGVTLFFTVKQNQFDTNVSDTTALVAKDVAMSGATTSFTIDPPDISDKWDDGTYYYDIKIKEAGTSPIVIYPGIQGTFRLHAHATNRES